MNVVALFCPVDAFCQAFEGPFIHHPLTTGSRPRGRAGSRCWSEPRTRLLGFCQSHYRTCKASTWVNRSSDWFFGFQWPGVFTHRGPWPNGVLTRIAHPYPVWSATLFDFTRR